jgi:transaldolase
MTSSGTQSVAGLRVKIFADGADRNGIAQLAANPIIRGFTTNPTLMRAAGVTDYEGFARDVLEVVPERPISFEVMSDDFDEMERQALKISAWGENVFVKIPITNCSGQPAFPLIRRLAAQGVQQNVTAIMTLSQVEEAAAALSDGPPGYVSLFAGRIADTGRDPLPMVRQAVEILGDPARHELVWASPRELLNLFQADEVRCHVITMTHDLLKKIGSVGKDLDQFSLETVQMFFKDAQAAGYTF